MKDLIHQLKIEHKQILEVLAQVKDLGISKRAGQEKLLAARELLIAHMLKEDAHYYPELKKAAQHQEELKITLDYFVKDMEAVSRQAMRLFDKYAKGGDEGAFAGEMKLLYMTLRDRIQTEEEVLFGKFPGREDSTSKK